MEGYLWMKSKKKVIELISFSIKIQWALLNVIMVNVLIFKNYKIFKAYFVLIQSANQRVCLVNAIICLIFSLYLCPKMITLSDVYSTSKLTWTIYQCFSTFFSMRNTFGKPEMFCGTPRLQKVH
jgi:hypothetical protein